MFILDPCIMLDTKKHLNLSYVKKVPKYTATIFTLFVLIFDPCNGAKKSLKP